jgi:cytochrome c biogenesis protein CcdA
VASKGESVQTKGWFGYAAFVLTVVLLGVVGYAAYLIYPRFNLPAVDTVGLFGLSIAAGIASFFSPCSFPLLATLLIRETRAEHSAADQRARFGKAFQYASALALGATVFLALTGGIIAAGGQSLLEGVTFTSSAGRSIRAVLGMFLVVLGLIQIGVLRAPFHRLASLARPLLVAQAHTRRRVPTIGFAIFGFAYVFAGFG